MSNPLTLLVRIQAKADRAEQVKRALIDILAPTRAEAGCVSYELHTDDKDPAVFIFVETWATREHWEAHNASGHLKGFLELAETAVESFAITEMSKVEV